MGGLPLPDGYHSVNPSIVVDDPERLINFLFGAAEQGRSLRPTAASTTAMSASGLPGDAERSQRPVPGPPLWSLRLCPGPGRHLPGRAGGRSDLDPGADRAVLGRPCLRLCRPFDNRWWVATHPRAFP